MKTFKNYIVEQIVFKEDIVSLLEASITKSSYGPGRQVVPRKKQLSSLSSALFTFELCLFGALLGV